MEHLFLQNVTPAVSSPDDGHGTGPFHPLLELNRVDALLPSGACTAMQCTRQVLRFSCEYPRSILESLRVQTARGKTESGSLAGDRRPGYGVVKTRRHCMIRSCCCAAPPVFHRGSPRRVSATVTGGPASCGAAVLCRHDCTWPREMAWDLWSLFIPTSSRSIFGGSTTSSELGIRWH